MDEQALALLKKQLLCTRIIAIICVAMLLITGIVLIGFKAELNIIEPRLENLLSELDAVNIDELAENAQKLSEALAAVDWNTVSTQLADASQALAEVDWKQLAGNINNIAVTAQSSITTTVQSLEAIDIDELNIAIRELHTVIQPLAKLVNLF